MAARLGYLAILLIVWPWLAAMLRVKEHTVVQITTFTLISLLYASQVITLHFQHRKPDENR
jgi:hypothetical protein